jgi:acetyl/propionyl-CoA carboxylase alpha subunit
VGDRPKSQARSANARKSVRQTSKSKVRGRIVVGSKQNVSFKESIEADPLKSAAQNKNAEIQRPLQKMAVSCNTHHERFTAHHQQRLLRRQSESESPAASLLKWMDVLGSRDVEAQSKPEEFRKQSVPCKSFEERFKDLDKWIGGLKVDDIRRETRTGQHGTKFSTRVKAGNCNDVASAYRPARLQRRSRKKKEKRECKIKIEVW